MNPQPKKKPYRIKGAGLRNLFESVLIRDDYTCQNPYCEHGSPLDPPHHILYKSQSGSDTPENLITLCMHCHDKVHNRGTLKINGTYGDLEFIHLEASAK